MCSEVEADPIISLKEVGKCYQVYPKPHHRLIQMFVRGGRKYYKEFWALKNITLDIKPGEVVGIIGSNGAGKSTLLQLVCGTLAPSRGRIEVRGRIAALLELGAGFNPEFTGRENVYLSATIAGMSRKEIDATFDSIVAFAGIEGFIDQPVKTYSSGMYVRLAFSVAINVDPDILVIDEALSVGDGEFSRKSFDRIMEMKKSGKTILFCSHALYQVEAICDSVLWLKHGKVAKAGSPSDVVMAYNDSLNIERNISESALKSGPVPVSVPESEIPEAVPAPAESKKTHDNIQVPQPGTASVPDGVASITGIQVYVDGTEGKDFNIAPLSSDLHIHLTFRCATTLPSPNVAVCFVRQDGQIVASTATHLDNKSPARTPTGGSAQVCFPALPLLKGTYQLDVYLMCEDGIHVYDTVNMAASLKVKQETLELGVVSLPHEWN